MTAYFSVLLIVYILSSFFITLSELTGLSRIELSWLIMLSFLFFLGSFLLRIRGRTHFEIIYENRYPLLNINKVFDKLRGKNVLFDLPY